MLINLAQKTPIVLLIVKKVNILTKYSYFFKIFLKEKVLILLKIAKLNQHTIEFQKNEQSFYKQIDNLSPLELKTLKTYIKTNLPKSFV